MSCPFKNALGVPGEGFHQFRFMGIAIGDTVGTIVLAMVISRSLKLPFLPVLLALLIVGEILHWHFCVDTAVIKFLKKTINFPQSSEGSVVVE